jgi:large subunit ribosomal protein L28
MKIFSNALGIDVKLRVASSTLRTINKNGGIDSFLINARFAKLTIEAQKLRNKIKKKLIAIDKISEVKNIK